jgi:SAM-dependent methyltransferase
MNTYRGLHARHYDVLYADKPYQQEARFVDALIRDAGVAGGRLLDVACGTGRHAAEFASLGWSVTGVDLSEALLELARANAPSAHFVCQDMRELDVDGGVFDAITCLFDAIGYAIDDEGVVATLTRLAGHLASSGALVVEFLHGPALIRNAAPLRVRRVGLPSLSGELLRLSETHLDESRRVMQVEFELLELRADGTYERWAETQVNRFFSVDEMAALLERSGLVTECLVPAFQERAQIDGETFHVLALARRVD